MQERQRPGHDVQAFDVRPRAELQLRPQLPGSDPDVPHDVVGGVEHQEHSRGQGHHPEGTSEQRRLALQRPLSEQAWDLAGEGDQRQQREDVAGHRQPQAVRQRVHVSPQAGKVLAAHPVPPLQVLDHQRDHGSHLGVDGQPGEARDQQGRLLPQQVVVPRRVLDQQEAVHAQPRHEENGGVEVDMQDVAVDDARVGPGLRLVVSVQVGEAWQRAQEGQVRHGQVEEVNVAALPLLQAEDVAEHDQEVPEEAEAELEDVERRQEVPLQQEVDLRAVLHLSARTATVAQEGRKVNMDWTCVQWNSAEFPRAERLIPSVLVQCFTYQPETYHAAGAAWLLLGARRGNVIGEQVQPLSAQWKQ